MKIINLIFLIFIVSLTCVFITFLTFTNIMIIDQKNIEVEFSVDDFVGLNVAKDKLYLGTIPPKGSGNRNITIENNHNKKVLVKIKTTNEISDFITIEKNNFILMPNESIEIKIKAIIPYNTEKKDYKGNLIITFLR
jgi:hypothetical protein